MTVTQCSANDRLKQCCEKVNMGTCMEMCAYNFNSSRVKILFQTGKCRPNQIEPFLKCAADGADNRDCCAHFDVIKNTGPQCNPFCNPSKGIGALGLQHMVCANSLKPIMQCHHIGLH